MVICEQCGARVADGRSFCETCGAFVEWDGVRLPDSRTAPAHPSARADAPAGTPTNAPAGTPANAPAGTAADAAAGAPASATEPRGAAPRPRLIRRVRSTARPAEAAVPPHGAQATTPVPSLPLSSTAPQSPPPTSAAAESAPGRSQPPIESAAPTVPEPRAAADPPGPCLSGGPAADGAPPPTPPPDRATGDESEISRSAALLMPHSPGPAGHVTEHRQPEAVRPGERNLPRPQVRQAIDDAAPAPGDLICGACGAGNRPTRNFCRRCAASLADAETVPPQPWWRRRALFRTAPLAGERPRRRWRIPRNRWFLPLAVLVTLACAGYLLRGPVESGFENVRDKLVKPREIHPLAGSEHASSAAPDHPAGLAFDGTTDQYWAPGSPGDGAGEFLEVGFTHPFRLVEIHVFPGVSTNEQAFLAQRRPSELQVAAVSADGRTTRKTLRLSDVPGEQVFQMHVSDVKRLRLTVVNSLGPKDRQVAIAEVAVFERP